MSYNENLRDHNAALQAILNAINSMPDSSGTAVELCTVSVNVMHGEGFIVASQWDGERVSSVFAPLPATDREWRCPKNSWIILYSPGNQGWSVDGEVEYYGDTEDHCTLLLWVAGGGSVEMY